MIKQTTLHSIVQEHGTYIAVIACSYESKDELSELEDTIIEIKEQLSMRKHIERGNNEKI